MQDNTNHIEHATVEIRTKFGSRADAVLFADELRGMYVGYAKRQGWHVQVISDSHDREQGTAEVVLRISGAGAYSQLQYETGSHRVQRVPEQVAVAELQGRMQTNVAYVAVLPVASPEQRNEIIRTYNIPSDRVTDHRIGFSVHGVSQVIQGSLDPLIGRLADEYREED